MAKMTKEQDVQFDKLYKETITWCDDDTCTGLFSCFGENLNNLATCVQDGEYLEILEFRKNYWSMITTLPINSKTKANLKKIVSHLMDKGFDTLSI